MAIWSEARGKVPEGGLGGDFHVGVLWEHGSCGGSLCLQAGYFVSLLFRFLCRVKIFYEPLYTGESKMVPEGVDVGTRIRGEINDIQIGGWRLTDSVQNTNLGP